MGRGNEIVLLMKQMPVPSDKEMWDVHRTAVLEAWGTTVDGWPAPKVTKYVNYNSHLSN